jgi:hypothetical protein
MVPGEETFDSLLTRRQAAQEQIKELRTIVAECDLHIGAVLDLNALKSVRWKDEYVVSRREGRKGSKKINPIRLMEKGVSAEVIEFATDMGSPGKPSISIRKINEPAGDDATGGGGLPDGWWD